MLFSPDIWKSLAGIAIFMLGMSFLEESVHNLAGRPFKLFLKKQTSNKIKGIAGGAITTGILQSSSIVNLVVLAFVGAGIIQMQNALAIILGANLGTTISSWIIAAVGFNFNIENFALPLTAVSGIAMILANKESRWYQWFRLVLGFSFLFLGLDFIKTGIEHIVKQIDLRSLENQPSIVFFLAGLLITTLIQSSSATVAIVLSAIYADAITLLAAMAMVLGAELGTTFKLLLASVRGVAAKKRVAFGNFLFNFTGTIIVLIFLSPVNQFITGPAGIKDNLIALVLFQTFLNVFIIILFYPFLAMFGKFLEKQFKKSENEDLFIARVPVSDTELALETLEKQTGHFLYQVLYFAADAFESEKTKPREKFSKRFIQMLPKEKYDYIKTIHGDMHNYAISLQNAAGREKDIKRTGQLISAMRNSMYAAKNLRDALHDIEQLRNSSNDTKYEFYNRNRQKLISFSNDIRGMIEEKDPDKQFKVLSALFKETQEGYTSTVKELYEGEMSHKVNEAEISTLINFNREMYTAFKSLSFALKDFLLDPARADYFEDLPGFIR